MHYGSTLHTHLAAVLQTGRPSSTAWESRDTLMSPDLTSCSSLRYTKECAAVGRVAGVEYCRLVGKAPGIHTFDNRHSQFGIRSLRWLSRTRQSQTATEATEGSPSQPHKAESETHRRRESASHNRFTATQELAGSWRCHGSGMPRKCPSLTPST